MKLGDKLKAYLRDCDRECALREEIAFLEYYRIDLNEVIEDDEKRL